MENNHVHELQTDDASAKEMMGAMETFVKSIGTNNADDKLASWGTFMTSLRDYILRKIEARENILESQASGNQKAEVK